jgi:hypothetical protein
MSLGFRFWVYAILTEMRLFFNKMYIFQSYKNPFVTFRQYELGFKVIDS